MFLEDIYDGGKEGDILTGGLGLLSDGIIGTQLAFTHHGISQGRSLLAYDLYSFEYATSITAGKIQILKN